MEDELNFGSNAIRPQYFGEWKMTSIFWKTEDDLNLLANSRRPQCLGK